MCIWGDEIQLLLPIPAELSYTGEFRWEFKGIDRCLAPIIRALNDTGIFTASCCCGHGKQLGHIWLHDGRVLVILPHPSKEDLEKYLRLEACATSVGIDCNADGEE